MSIKNDCAIFIPARAGSKTIKNKNLINFCGKPLICWTIEQALNTKFYNHIYVSSDSNKILKIAEKYKVNLIKRPQNISGDNAQTELAMEHFVNKSNKKYKYIILLQPTSPLRHSKDIEKALKHMIKQKKKSLFSACLFSDLTMWNKKNRVFKSYNYDYENRKPRQKESTYIIENGSIYISTVSNLLKNKNRLVKNSISYYIMNKLQLFEIDDYADLSVCKKIFINKIY